MKKFIKSLSGIDQVASILLFLLFALTLVIDITASKPETHSGVLIDKIYKPESNGSGVGYGMSVNGSSGLIVTTTTHEKESFIVVIENDSGEIITLSCEPDIYYSKSIGDTVSYNLNKGFFTKLIYSKNEVK